MEGYQIKQGASSRYEEYRNQMKKSKKSEEYRTRRSQQMVEAQMLLEKNMQSQKTSSDVRSLLEPKSRALKNRHSNHSMLTNGNTEGEHRSEVIDVRRNHTKTDPTNFHSFKNSVPQDETNIPEAAQELIKRNSVSKKSLRVQNESIPGKDIVMRSSSDCPKVKELRHRMMIRKEKRRLRLNAMSNKPVSQSPSENQRKTTVTTLQEEVPIVEDFVNESCETNPDILEMPNDEFEENLRVPSRTPEIKDYDVVDDDTSVVEIDLIYCHHCQRSYAPKTYEKFCTRLDEKGLPMCMSIRNKKRKVFNSAKMRIKNNSQLSSEEQQTAITGRKKAVTDLRQKLKGTSSSRRRNKWREESESFRQAMETNRLIAKAEKEGKPSHYYL